MKRKNKYVCDVEELESVGISKCEGPCQEVTECLRCPSHTQYYWDGKGEDPNADLILCKCCAEEYLEMMEDQWYGYYSNLM
jgi:hypothetical protein